METVQIPNNLFFIWLGPSLPWWAQIAIRTALKHSEVDKITIYFDGIKSFPSFGEKQNERLVWIEIDSKIFQSLPISESEAWRLYTSLKQPAAKSNLLRLSILYSLGGIYSDLDVLVIKSFAPLLHLNGFCGVEPIALPASLDQQKTPFKWIFPALLLAFRELCVRLPRGYKLFARFKNKYYMAVNNAVLGSIPQNPLIGAALSRIAFMDEKERYIRYQLGTHLLQTVTQNKSTSTFDVLNDEWFYPLGPEICRHWFLESAKNDWDKLVTDNTIVVHWYQSVEGRFLKEALDEKWLLSHPNTPYAKWVKFLLES